ncbi:MAG: A/G-specific adenine glycosylase [Chloroflexota bacterium]|nr:A/G-specific adenine glycosylase [Chloroflexota bacterium]
MAPEIASLPDVQAALLGWHRQHGLRAPWRESGEPYHVLVAAVMAQQTQMSRVLPAYARFLAAFPSVEALAAASAADVIRAWAGLGYNQRALRLHRAARTIAADGWPRDAAALARIEGIGPFTAAIVASFAFGQPAACVDTNVRRVLARLSGDESLRGAALQRLADDVLAAAEPARWNQALMDYGASVCTPRPKCAQCVVARWCVWRARKEPPLALVADERATYDARPTRRRQPAYAGSRRYYRGRTLDVLRALAPGERIRIDALPALIGDGHPAPYPGDLRELIDGLVRDGLAALHDADGTPAVSLPDD